MLHVMAREAPTGRQAALVTLKVAARHRSKLEDASLTPGERQAGDGTPRVNSCHGPQAILGGWRNWGSSGVTVAKDIAHGDPEGHQQGRIGRWMRSDIGTDLAASRLILSIPLVKSASRGAWRHGARTTRRNASKFTRSSKIQINVYLLFSRSHFQPTKKVPDALFHTSCPLDEIPQNTRFIRVFEKKCAHPGSALLVETTTWNFQLHLFQGSFPACRKEYNWLQPPALRKHRQNPCPVWHLPDLWTEPVRRRSVFYAITSAAGELLAI